MRICLLFSLLLFQPLCLNAETETNNLLPNPSFESETDGQPRNWRQSRWSGTGSYSFAKTGRTGKRSLLVTSEQGADIGWTTNLTVKPHSTYRLSGWIKTENVTTPKERAGRGALLNLHNIQPVATIALKGTNDWTKVEILFETGADDSLQVNCLFGGWGMCTGKAWYDDLCLELLSSENWKPSIAIDATQKGQPVSKYIYGQFIEHLGRCIYGGIWAEMLEDRKFAFPVTPEYKPYVAKGRVAADAPFPVVGASPWQIIGPAESVTMVKKDSFVGDHTPCVTAGGGIRQNDLGVVSGKQYDGYVWLRAKQRSTRVTLTLSAGKDKLVLEPAGADYARFPFQFTAQESTDKASLAIQVEKGACFVGTVSLMPADNVDGMRADTLALLKELDSPVYRWPGGNFVSGYDWKDGIGDRDRRPPRQNPAWTGVEHNDFGLHEFITFCRHIDTEPLVVVNTGLGGVEDAVKQLQYCNAGADTPMGKQRSTNGHVEPMAVEWWGVGNEMYGGWQLGHMPLEDYIKKNNVFVEAMRAADPTIKVIAVGATGPWSEGMMQHSADHMDLISEHFYCQMRPGLASHVGQMSDAVRRKAEAHRDYRKRFDSLKGKDIDIALDEWNYWYGPYEFGELGTRYFLKDALGVAAALHEYVRQSDIMFMANYAQTVNVIGCIKTTKTEAGFAATALPLMLYRKHFGVTPLAVTTQQPLDVAAALSEDGRTLTIGIVNPTKNELELPLKIDGLKLAGKATKWQIAGEDPDAYNVPGKPPEVRIEESALDRVGDTISVPACSITLIAVGVGL